MEGDGKAATQLLICWFKSPHQAERVHFPSLSKYKFKYWSVKLKNSGSSLPSMPIFPANMADNQPLCGGPDLFLKIHLAEDL